MLQEFEIKERKKLNPSVFSSSLCANLFPIKESCFVFQMHNMYEEESSQIKILVNTRTLPPLPVGGR